MVCKNCGHELYKDENEETGEIKWLHENRGWSAYSEKCYVENCKCNNPEPDVDDLNV
jgi:hypothetical protein